MTTSYFGLLTKYSPGYISVIWVEKVVSKNKQICRKGGLESITGY